MVTPLSLVRSLRALSSLQADDLNGKHGANELRVDGETPGLLCLHGFTGAPFEVQLGLDVATELGMAAIAPRLAGHGRTALDLSATRFEDWVESARPAFDELRRKGPVFIMGLSMGTLVATKLALEAPGDVLGLALLANAFWLNSPYPSAFLAAADRLGDFDFGIKKSGFDMTHEENKLNHVSYRNQPLRSAVSLLRAGEMMRDELHRLHRPTLLLHGAKDGVCPVDNAWKAAERIGTRDTKVVVYPNSRHILSRDVERDQVATELRAFFRRLTPPNR